MSIVISRATHSVRIQCLDGDCDVERASTSRLDDAQLRYAAQEHARATGHRVQFFVLERTTYDPGPGAT